MRFENAEPVKVFSVRGESLPDIARFSRTLLRIFILLAFRCLYFEVAVGVEVKVVMILCGVNREMEELWTTECS